MALTVSHFQDCNIKDFYESLLYFATKMDTFLDKMSNSPVNSGKYIDAKVMLSEWERSYDAAIEALKLKFGDTMCRQIVKMVDADIVLVQQRRKMFS